MLNIKFTKATFTVEIFLNTEEDPVFPLNTTDESIVLLQEMPAVEKVTLHDKRVIITLEYDTPEQMTANVKTDAAWCARFLNGA